MLKVKVSTESVELYESLGKREVVEHAVLLRNQPVFYPKEGVIDVGYVATSWRVDLETSPEEIRRLAPQAERDTVYVGCTEVVNGVIEFGEFPDTLEPEIREALRAGKKIDEILAEKLKIAPEYFWHMLGTWVDRIRYVYFPAWLRNLLPPELDRLLRQYKVRPSSKVAIEATFWQCEEAIENALILGNEVVRVVEREVTKPLFAMEFRNISLEQLPLDKILVDLLPRMTEIVLAYKDVKEEEEKR